jgi:hypothetical protein
MSLFPLGILSAAGASGFDYEQIATTVLGTASSSITFSNLATVASGYRHLQLRVTSRANDGGNTFEAVYMRFNGISTASSYSFHDLSGNGSAVSSGASANSGTLVAAFVTGSASTTSAFGAGVVDILDALSTTKNKTIRSLNGRSSATNSIIFLSSGAFYSTNALTSIELSVAFASNFAVGSRFSLYGIRG